MFFQRHYFFSVSKPSDFDIVFEHVKRKYILNRGKYGDLFKTDRTKIVNSYTINCGIYLLLSMILLISTIFVPSRFQLTELMISLSLVFLLMSFTFILTILIVLPYQGNSVIISYIFNEFIIAELVFLIGYFFITFSIIFFIVFFEVMRIYLLILLFLPLAFCILFYLFSHFSYRVVAFADIYFESDNKAKQANGFVRLINKNPFLTIVLLLIPFANLLALVILLLGRQKEEGIVINKVG